MICYLLFSSAYGPYGGAFVFLHTWAARPGQLRSDPAMAQQTTRSCYVLARLAHFAAAVMLVCVLVWKVQACAVRHGLCSRTLLF